MSAANNVLFTVVAAALREAAVPGLTSGFPNHRKAMGLLVERRILRCGIRLARFEFQAECSLDAWLAARKAISEDDVCVAPLFANVEDRGYNEDYILFSNIQSLARHLDMNLTPEMLGHEAFGLNSQSLIAMGALVHDDDFIAEAGFLIGRSWHKKQVAFNAVYPNTPADNDNEEVAIIQADPSPFHYKSEMVARKHFHLQGKGADIKKTAYTAFQMIWNRTGGSDGTITVRFPCIIMEAPLHNIAHKAS